MNYKTLIAAATLALGAASAFAVEATQFNIVEPVLTRAEVRAELARASAAGELEMRGETYGSFTASDLAFSPRHADTRVDDLSRTAKSAINSYYIGG